MTGEGLASSFIINFYILMDIIVAELTKER